MNKTKKAIGLLVITCATIAAILATIQTLSGELQSKIGYGYGNGIFFSKNHNKAFKWFLKSAERGNAKGQSNVGVCYYYGYGTEKNYGKAFEFYKKSADQGYSAGQFHLGICYLEGRGTSVDIPKAIHYLELAKKQNQPKAGEILEKALSSFKIPTSSPEGLPSIEQLTAFAEKGDAKAQYNLGSAYLNGWGCNPRPEDGFRWWKRSAEEGFSEGQYGLACLYLQGKGTIIDNKAAVDWLKKAADQNNAKAQRDLGAFYLDGGPGVSMNIQEGLRLTRLAVEQGDPIAE